MPVAGASAASSRGFEHDLCIAIVIRDALVVSEYLCGEGGNVHCVGIARFLLLWEQDGSGRIEKWWIEE